MSAAPAAPAAAPARRARAAPADGAPRPVRAARGAGAGAAHPSSAVFANLLTHFTEFHFAFLLGLDAKAGRVLVLDGLVPPAKEKKGAAPGAGAEDGADGADADGAEPDGADADGADADGADADGAEPAPGAGKGKARRPAGPRFYQTADNLRHATPETGRVNHTTITTLAREILGGLLHSLARLSDRTAYDPSSGDDLVARLLAAAQAEPSPEGDVLRVIHHVVATAGPALRAPHLCAERDFPAKIQDHFRRLVADPMTVDPGADAVARLFLNFCRVLAVHIAARVHASQHRLTLSPGALAEVLAGVGALAPLELQGAFLAVGARVQAEGAEKTLTAKALAAQKKEAKKLQAAAEGLGGGAEGADLAEAGEGTEDAEAPAPAPKAAALRAPPAGAAPRGPAPGGGPRAPPKAAPAPAPAAHAAAPAAHAAPAPAPAAAKAAPRAPPAGGGPRGAVRPVAARPAANPVDYSAVMGDLEGGL
jgi:hypothetical protein